MNNHFDEIAHIYEAQLPKHVVDLYIKKKMSFVRKHSANGKVLDLGCGVGLYSKELSKAFSEVVGIDISEKALEIAKKTNKGINSAIFQNGDARKINFPDRSFDAVFCTNTIHHMPEDWKKAIDEMVRVTKRDGKIFIFEINTTNPLYKFYMEKIFPRRKNIDCGDEKFLLPHEIIEAAGARCRVVDVDYFTMTPDFSPKWFADITESVEGELFKIDFLKRNFGIHYAVVLMKI